MSYAPDSENQSFEQARDRFIRLTEKIVANPKPPSKRPYAGCMSGTFGEMSDDFNEPLDDFKDYM
jgi:hypothetical protein